MWLSTDFKSGFLLQILYRRRGDLTLEQTNEIITWRAHSGEAGYDIGEEEY